jgi:TPR repeat protein
MKIGNLDAITNLGFCYQNGICVNKDYSKAVQYYNQAVKGENSQSKCVCFCVCYQQGLCVNKYLNKAFTFYEKAVKLGYSKAISPLGLCYKTGRVLEKDYSKVIELFQQGMTLGENDAVAN